MADYSTIEAGRELDNLIAEKIFPSDQFNHAFSSDTGECIDCGAAMDKVLTGGPKYCFVPAFSIDIKAAFEVFEKIRASCKWCCLRIYSDHDYHWYVSFVPSNYDEVCDPHEPTVKADSYSLPHAICLAALKAVEGKENANGV